MSNSCQFWCNGNIETLQKNFGATKCRQKFVFKQQFFQLIGSKTRLH